MITLRPYQEEAVLSALQFFAEESSDKPIIYAPTAAGKSIIIAHIAKELGKQVLVLQPSVELLKQNFAKFSLYSDEGAIYSSSLTKERGLVNFATIGSIYKEPENWQDIFFIVVDECHLVPPSKPKAKKLSMYEAFFREMPQAQIIGLSATPFRLKTYRDPFARSRFAKYSQINLLPRERPRFFNKFLHLTQIGEMYEQNYLTPINYIKMAFDGTFLEYNSTGADFTAESIEKALRENKMYEKLPLVVNQALEKGRKHVLVFMSSVDDAKEYSKIVPHSAYVSSDMKYSEREEILDKFTRGEIKAVFNVGILTTGFDFPALDTIILARPTNSLALYMQMVGRGIRLYEGKENCAVVDMAGNFDRFGKIENIELINDPSEGWILRNELGQLSGVRLN